MIIEQKAENRYTAIKGERVLLTIDRWGDVFRFENNDTRMTVKIVPLDEERTVVEMIEHKRRGKDGKYRKTTRLMQHDMKWALYMAEEKGFIRRAAGNPIETGKKV